MLAEAEAFVAKHKCGSCGGIRVKESELCTCNEAAKAGEGVMPNETGGPWVMGEPASNRAEHKCVDGTTKYFRADICVACLTARLAEAEAHEQQTHERLGVILGTDTSLEDAAKRMAKRLAAAEAERDVARLDLAIEKAFHTDTELYYQLLRKRDEAAKAGGGSDL